MFKLLLWWNIVPGREEECLQFMMSELAPGLMELGLQPTDVWYTIYGERPQIQAGGVAETRDAMREILRSQRWLELRQKLQDYAVGLGMKVVRASGMYQI